MHAYTQHGCPREQGHYGFMMTDLHLLPLLSGQKVNMRAHSVGGASTAGDAAAAAGTLSLDPLNVFSPPFVLPVSLLPVTRAACHTSYLLQGLPIMCQEPELNCFNCTLHAFICCYPYYTHNRLLLFTHWVLLCRCCFLGSWLPSPPTALAPMSVLDTHSRSHLGRLSCRQVGWWLVGSLSVAPPMPAHSSSRKVGR
jgi:hypothetical protein